MKKIIKISTILFLTIISLNSNAQTTVELKNDTLYCNGKAIYEGLEMKLGRLEKNKFDNVTMSMKASFQTFKAPMGDCANMNLKINSKIKEKNKVYSFKFKGDVAGAALMTYSVTDVIAAIESKELLFKD